MTGYTRSSDMVMTDGVAAPRCGSTSACFDAFVTKLSAPANSSPRRFTVAANSISAGRSASGRRAKRSCSARRSPLISVGERPAFHPVDTRRQFRAHIPGRVRPAAGTRDEHGLRRRRALPAQRGGLHGRRRLCVNRRPGDDVHGRQRVRHVPQCCQIALEIKRFTVQASRFTVHQVHRSAAVNRMNPEPNEP